MKPGLCPLTLVIILVFCIVISGCSQDLSTINPLGSKSSLDTIIDANNRFSLSLYSNLAGDTVNNDKNLFFSPWSISSVMAVSYEGARNKTADEIREVFSFPDNRSKLRDGYANLNNEVNENNPAYTLRTANALWTEKTYALLPEYSQISRQFYGANTENIDFINDAEGSRNTINSWVAKKTDDKITNMVSQGEITPDTKLIITNAIYFKGTWLKQFETKKTSDQTFKQASGNIVHVQMMVRDDHDSVFKYGETDQIQILEMEYLKGNGKQLSMLLLLPRENNLLRLEKTLDSNKLAELKRSMTNQLVIVYVPKFRLDTEYKLSRNLASMGMPTAFSNSADFSGIDGTQTLMIDDVIHKAYVAVDEEGTEAAASTAAYMTPKGEGPRPPPVFRADHPFIFIIQDSENGNILFMGRITNPNEG
ncbi:MAG: serpin family protein [Methanoregula sp.]|jgi:serpin B